MIEIVDVEESSDERTSKQILEDNGYDPNEIVTYENFSYDSALVGMSSDGRAIYDYNKMVEWIMRTQGWSEEEAIEWIDYNTMGAHICEEEPIIMFPMVD